MELKRSGTIRHIGLSSHNPRVARKAALSGYVAVCFSGHPLGFGKAAGGTLKNHLPKGLRIR